MSARTSVKPHAMILVFLLIACGARAAVFYVYPDGSGSHPTIASAVAASSAGDRILLRPAPTPAPAPRVSVHHDLEFNATPGCTIDCEGLDRAFVIDGCNVTMWGLTITNGHAFNGGAILLPDQGFVDLNDCDFVDNTADNAGGAVYAFSRAAYRPRIPSQGHTAGNVGGALFQSTDCNSIIYRTTMSPTRATAARSTRRRTAPVKSRVRSSPSTSILRRSAATTTRTISSCARTSTATPRGTGSGASAAWSAAAAT